jgi:hypothetical protein
MGRQKRTKERVGHRIGGQKENRNEEKYRNEKNNERTKRNEDNEGSNKVKETMGEQKGTKRTMR